MLIAQITDIHIGFERDTPDEMNRQRLDAMVRHLAALDPRPDLLLCTGDLTDRGDRASYERLREALAPLPFPYFLAVGNHDLRTPLREVFPETRSAGGFIQYVIDPYPVRIIVIDTLEENRHAGAFGPDRARWLDARLREAPDRPTLLVLHHPPVFTGIDWMTLGPEERWAPALTAVVERYDHVVGAIAGHIHRPIVAPWAGTILRVCASCAPQVTLDLKPMDLERPDGRALIQEEPPAYALHMWTPGGLVTHFGRVETPEVLLRFDSGFQPVLKHFEVERKQDPAYPGEGRREIHGLLALLFDVSGRLSRAGFVATLLCLAMAGVALAYGIERTLPRGSIGAGVWAIFVALGVIAWPTIAIAVKRAHDLDRRAGWLLLALAPVIGTLWVLAQLCFRGSSLGAIRFGATPGRTAG